MDPRTGTRLILGLLVAAVTVLCVMTTLLARQNRALKAQLAQSVRDQLPATLAVGQTLPALNLVDHSGVVIRMAPDAEHPALLLLIVSHDCPHCARTVPLYDEVLTQVANPKLRVLAIQTDAKRPEDIRPLPATMTPVYAVDAPKTWLRDVPIVPSALLINRNGVITHQWLGEIVDRDEFMFAIIGAGVE